MKQTVVKFSDLLSVNTTLYELTCLRRWSEVTVEGGKFTELSKQALNCIIAYFWAIEARNKNAVISLMRFPKIAIRRGFVKDFQCDVPEANLDRIFHLGNVSKKDFDEAIRFQMEKDLSESFLKLLEVEQGCLEIQIYQAATKLATLIELEEIRNGISNKDYQRKKEQIEKSINEFSNLPGFSEMTSKNYMELFHEFSKLRNRIRWAKHPNIIKCSVLGHLFDVAVFAYLMSLETHPADEELATRHFFIGIFHDIAEKWTGDMPSPVKDSIKGLRQATEEFEREVLEEYVYSNLPDYLVKAIQEVMLEDKRTASLKAFSKKSDNFSAFVECWRELDAGSRHKYYRDVMEKSYSKKESLSEIFRLLTENLYDGIRY